MFATGAPGNCRGKDFFPKLINADPDQWRWWKARNSFWDTRSFSAYRKSHKYLFGLKCKLKTFIWPVLRASLFPHNSCSQEKSKSWSGGPVRARLNWVSSASKPKIFRNMLLDLESQILHPSISHTHMRFCWFYAPHSQDIRIGSAGLPSAYKTLWYIKTLEKLLLHAYYIPATSQGCCLARKVPGEGVRRQQQGRNWIYQDGNYVLCTHKQLTGWYSVGSNTPHYSGAADGPRWPPQAGLQRGRGAWQGSAPQQTIRSKAENKLLVMDSSVSQFNRKPMTEIWERKIQRGKKVYTFNRETQLTIWTIYQGFSGVFSHWLF